MWEKEKSIIGDWILVDLDNVRKLGMLNNQKEITNYDGSSNFISISANELFLHGCLVAYKSQKIKSNPKNAY